MFRSFVHIILAGLVFLSSSGFVVQKHFCFDMLIATSFFTEVEKCSGARTHEQATHDPVSKDTALNKKSCCDDLIQFFQVDYLENITAKSTLDIQAIAPPNIVIIPVTAPVCLPIQYERYKPPLLFCDLSVRFQSFLC